RYHGAVIGRVCGRIGKGSFELDGTPYQLTINDRFGQSTGNHLHGGSRGFSFRVWQGQVGVNAEGEEALTLTLFSKDGDEGYPGNLNATVRYTLGNDNAMRIDYSARTDRTTLVNLTNHAYFNLHGQVEGDALDHSLCIYADRSVKCDHELIPTGDIISIKDTPLDFTRPTTIGARIHESFPGHLFPGKGYVMSYVLNDAGNRLRLGATVEEKGSGRITEVYTDQPGIRFYRGWLFDGSDIGKGGKRYTGSSGIALEAQGFPDAPNQPGFPSIALLPGNEYRQTTVYRFLAK